MNSFFLIFSFFLPISSYASSKECWSDSPKSCSLTGSLELHTYPGRPNYEDIQKGDEAETGLYLKLDYPMTIHFMDGVNNTISTIEQISLMQIAGEFDDRFFRVAKKKNHVSINSPIFESQTGHHHTHFLIDANNNIVVDKK